MKKYRLSKSEERVMEILWQEGEPLTIAQIVRLADDMEWKANYVTKVMSFLVEKEMVNMCGVTLERNHYSRQFVPLMDKDEYAAGLLNEAGIRITDLPDIAAALVRKSSGRKKLDGRDQKLIGELEDMIARYSAEDDALDR